MFATLITLALFAAPALNGVAAFDINTPKVTECSPAQVTWDATKGPYNLLVVSPNDPCGDILADLGDHNGTSMTWTPGAAFKAGTQLLFSLEDANGDEAWSGNVTVAAGSDTACLNAASATSASAADSPATIPAGDATVEAAGAAVTGGGSSAEDPSAQGALGASSSSGASALHMSPIMALSALFVAAALL
ncbi:hypothetical protein C8F04DRAFT_1222394 [Mycena alexandri]|uniref:Uncharacterized protein n=1 Tax=Mycena alexandri TaxID=1745969 RepID=A0AAD6SNG5_9AGAR|nr:hypothetical protein C8F04DRAFT_1222394 [Mycena alexandri]